MRHARHRVLYEADDEKGPDPRRPARAAVPEYQHPCGARAMTGGWASRDKGNRTERAIVRLLQEYGLAGERVPLSGVARGRFGGDISVPVLGRDLRGEEKARGNGFNRLYVWLDGRDFLVINRKSLLVVATLELAAEIVMAAERARGRML